MKILSYILILLGISFFIYFCALISINEVGCIGLFITLLLSVYFLIFGYWGFVKSNKYYICGIWGYIAFSTLVIANLFALIFWHLSNHSAITIEALMDVLSQIILLLFVHFLFRKFKYSAKKYLS